MMKDLRAKAAARIQQRLRTDLERTAGVEAKLNGQLRQLAGAAGSATPKAAAASDLATDIARLRDRYTTVDEQLHNLMLEDSAPGAVHSGGGRSASAASDDLWHAAQCGAAGRWADCCWDAGGGDREQDGPQGLHRRRYGTGAGLCADGVLPDFDEVSNEVSAEHLLRLSSAIEHARKQGDLNSCIFTGTAAGVWRNHAGDPGERCSGGHGQADGAPGFIGNSARGFSRR